MEKKELSPKHLQFGKRAEDIACDFLYQKGFKLLERNYSCYVGEIDLIMQDRDDIVFVEVRARHREDYGNPLESITPGKMKKLIRAATCYLQWKNCLYTVTSRFDLIGILCTDRVRIEWIKNAF